MAIGKPTRYSGVAMLLHWLIAIAVILNWRIAEHAHGLPKAEHDAVMQYHFEVGITVLLLTVLRIVWRLVHRPPPLGSHLQPWERLLARALHTVFYILLIGLPLFGWIGISGYGSHFSFWGLLQVGPLPVGFGPDTAKSIIEVHETFANIFLWLIALHVLGALKHTFYDKDGNLWRMLPFGTPRG